MARAPADLRREIATIETDPNRMLFGRRILPEDATLATRGAGKGLWLYDELERDGQVFATLQTRRLALLGRRWEVDPADDTPAAARAAEMVGAALSSLGVERLAEALFDALLKGLAIVELIWEPADGLVLPVVAKARDPRRFAFRAEPDSRGRIGYPLRLLTRTQPLEGEPVPERKFVVHRVGARYDNPWGLGLGHRLFWPVFFKRQGVAFWLSGLEKFGQPTALGRYPNGTPEAEQKKLLAALQAIATDAGVAVPEGMVIELLEAKRSGTFDAYEGLARYMDEDIAKMILGQTLTTQVGASGSRALGEVHNDVRLEITKGDADLLSATLNATLVRWIVEVNMPGAPPPRLWWDVSEPDDLTAASERDERLLRIGYRPSAQRIADVYGEGYEPVTQPAPPPDGLARLFAERGVRTAPRRTMPPAAPRDVADELTDQLAGMLDGEDPMIRAIEALVARAGSLQEVADQLAGILGEARDERLAELMAQALIVANLTGRADLADDV
jgi:phage gp29-like protein